MRARGPDSRRAMAAPCGHEDGAQSGQPVPAPCCGPGGSRAPARTSGIRVTTIPGSDFTLQGRRPPGRGPHGGAPLLHRPGRQPPGSGRCGRRRRATRPGREGRGPGFSGLVLVTLPRWARVPARSYYHTCIPASSAEGRHRVKVTLSTTPSTRRPRCPTSPPRFAALSSPPRFAALSQPFPPHRQGSTPLPATLLAITPRLSLLAT